MPQRPSWSALGLLLAAGLAPACEEPNTYVAPPPPTVTVAKPIRQQVTDYLMFTGRTVAVAETDLVARVEGVLEEVHFDDGEFVEEGKLLFSIEQDEYIANMKAATAAVAEAQAGLALADATLQRVTKAAQTNAVSELDVLQAQAERDGAEARLFSAQAKEERAKLDLEWTQISAPMTGRISRTYVDPGNVVGRGAQTRLATIVQFDPIYAEFDMNERDLLSIIDFRTDDGEIIPEEEYIDEVRDTPVELARTIDEGYPFPGMVFYVDPEVDANTGTLIIRGIFENPAPYQMYPGLFAKVRTPVREKKALLLPELALGTDQGGRYALVVGDDDIVEYRQVVVGQRLGENVVIESGIEADDRVIVNGLLRARPGSPVTPQTADAGDA